MMRVDFVEGKINTVLKFYKEKLDDAQLQIWVKGLKNFDQNVFIGVMDKWCAEEKKAPKLWQLTEKCARSESHFASKNAPSLADRCSYRDPEETPESRSMCREPSASDIQAAKAQGWTSMCQWHYECSYARAFPDSSTAVLVESLLVAKRTEKPVEKPRAGWATEVFKKPAA